MGDISLTKHDISHCLKVAMAKIQISLNQLIKMYFSIAFFHIFYGFYMQFICQVTNNFSG